MAEESPKGNIAVQGITFEMSAVDAISGVLSRADQKVESTAKRFETMAARITNASRTSGDKVSAVFGEEVPGAFDTAAGAAEEGASRLSASFKRHSAIMDDAAKKAVRRSVDVKKSVAEVVDSRALLRSKSGLTFDGFDEVKKQASAMVKVLDGHLVELNRRGKVHADKFLQQNSRAIRGVISEYREFGRSVPRTLKEVEKSLDALEKKQSGTFMKMEDLFGRIKQLGVKNTLIGATSAGMLAHGYGQAEEIYAIGSEAAKTTMGGEGLVEGRRTELVEAKKKTGATGEELGQISKAHAELAYLGKASLTSLAQTTMAFSRATGTSVNEAAKFGSTLQQQFKMTDEAVARTTEQVAFLAKASGASVDEIMATYDQLKFVRFSLDGNAEAAGRMAKSTARAAAEMSKYGLDARKAGNDIKGVMDGGMDEYQQNLQAAILGGMSPQEAMALMDDIAGGIEGAAERFEKVRGNAAANLRQIGGRGGAGRAMGNDLQREFLGVGGVEADQMAAYAKGALPKGELETGMESPAAMATSMADAIKEFATASDLASRGIERGQALVAESQRGVYDVARSAMEKFDASMGEGGPLQKAAAWLGHAGMGLVGAAVSLGAAALTLRSGAIGLKELGFLKDAAKGPAAAKTGGFLRNILGLGKSAIPTTGGVAGAAEIAGAGTGTAATGTTVAGAGGLAGLGATSVGAASGAAVAGTVGVGLGAGLALGYGADKLTDQFDTTKKAKHRFFDMIVDPGSLLAGKDYGKGRLRGTAAGKSVEDLRLERTRKQAAGAYNAPVVSAEDAKISNVADAAKSLAGGAADSAGQMQRAAAHAEKIQGSLAAASEGLKWAAGMGSAEASFTPLSARTMMGPDTSKFTRGMPEGAPSELSDIIARHEGFYVQGKPLNHAQRNNNPGNIRVDAEWKRNPEKAQVIAEKQGAVGYDPKSGFLKFATVEAGFKGLERQLAIYAKRGLTVGEMVHKYAPPKENNTRAYVAQFTKRGYDPNMPMSAALAKAQGSAFAGAPLGAIPARAASERGTELAARSSKPTLPFTGTTKGESDMLGELKKAVMLLSRIAFGLRDTTEGRPPNPMIAELNSGGLG